jgi:N-carbamoylputrescine amidase
MCGHAAANVVPVIASNRIGPEQAKHNPQLEMTFYGSSFIADQMGNRVAEANRTDETVLVHTFDLDAIAEHRLNWGVYRDRRPDLYGAIRTLDGRVAPAAA